MIIYFKLKTFLLINKKLTQLII